MKRKELIKLGFGNRQLSDLAMVSARSAARAGFKKPALRRLLRDLAANPTAFEGHEHFAELAAKVAEQRDAAAAYEPRREQAPYRRWGDDIDPQA
ncbi:MAG: RtcB family protein, partial [Acidobacteriota bacterium]